MKKRLLTCFYLSFPIVFQFISVQGYAQEANISSYKYIFSVEDVTNPASAKEMTDYIRPIFNTEEVPFKYFPSFNNTSKQFEFESTVHVSESELAAVLEHYALVLLSFNAVSKVAENSEEK